MRSIPGNIEYNADVPVVIIRLSSSFSYPVLSNEGEFTLSLKGTPLEPEELDKLASCNIKPGCFKTASGREV